MERSICVVAVAILLGASGFHCRKSSSNNVWTGKLVVYAACADYVVQLQSGPISDSAILAQSWTDTANDSTYTNVFRVSDICTFAAAGVDVGDVFTFTLNGPVPTEVCMPCDIVPNIPMPATSNSVTNIKLVTNH